MSDVSEWLEERRRVHDAAPRGAWETSSAERDAFYNLPTLLTAIEKVLELHSRVIHSGFADYCSSCVAFDDPYDEDAEYAHRVEYPCPTVQSVRSAIERSE